MRILITGAGGQLGRDLQLALEGHDVVALTHAELDVTDASTVFDAVESARPAVVLHTAALTDTTRCEREPDVALLYNGIGAQNVAVACGRVGAAMVHVSTNEVFDGAQAEPYRESDEPHPLNAYGRSKLAGEGLIQESLPQHYIVRTAWLYGPGGNNFVAKVLSRAESGAVSGVVDEVATPTWTRELAHAIVKLIETDVYGVYHLTNAGQASRYEWVREILRLAGKEDVPVREMTTAEFRAEQPQAAVAPRKPPQSVLANAAGAQLGIELRPWQQALAEYIAARG
ncbi:MAG: dTDP-4-dehydrorhamnose reductase [Dehalococcoidia bacterium]